MESVLVGNTVAVFLAGFAFAIVMVALIGQIPRSILVLLRVFGRLFRPLRRLGRLRIVRKLFGRSRIARQPAAEGTTEITRPGLSETEIDRALRHGDDSGAEYDFKTEENLLARGGWLFKSIRIPAEYLPAHLIGPLTDEVATMYVAQATKFFSIQVTLQANPHSLYEDAEGAFVVSLFRSIDRRCYYVLNEIRKTINDNARRLVLILSGILAAWTVHASWVFRDIVAHSAFGVDLARSAKPLTWTLGAWIAAIIVAYLCQTVGYKQQQQHTVRELRLFLIKYLGRIADRYREITGNAKQVTVGDETDSKKLSEAAQKWHKIMVWIPFRTFFTECFVRNIWYQISRNCGYYILIPWASLVAVLACLYSFDVLPASSLPAPVLGSSAFLLCCGLLVAMFASLAFLIFNRVHAVVLAEEMSHIDWLGYEDLNVSSAMDAVVGKYAEEVGFWKERFKL